MKKRNQMRRPKNNIIHGRHWILILFYFIDPKWRRWLVAFASSYTSLSSPHICDIRNAWKCQIMVLTLSIRHSIYVFDCVLRTNDLSVFYLSLSIYSFSPQHRFFGYLDAKDKEEIVSFVVFLFSLSLEKTSKPIPFTSWLNANKLIAYVLSRKKWSDSVVLFVLLSWIKSNNISSWCDCWLFNFTFNPCRAHRAINDDYNS